MSALDNVPGLGGYVAAQNQQQAQQAGQLQQVAQVLGLQQAMRKAAVEQQMRSDIASLGPNPSTDALGAVVSKYDPLQGFKIRQASEDRKAQLQAANERALAQLEQRSQFNDMMHEYRMAQARSEQDKQDEAARHNQVKEEIDRLRAQMTNNAVSPTEVLDPSDPTRMLRVDARVYKGGTLGAPGVIGVSGKEPVAAKKAEQVDSGRQGVNNLVATLSDLYKQLHEGGGITDPAQGALGNVGAAISASKAGQMVGGALGTKNQSLRNQIAQQRPLLLQAIKQATGMTAKQMDSNVELKMYLAAATDPTLDYRANMAALQKLDELFGLGGQTKAQQQPPAGGAPARQPQVVDFGALK